MLGDRIPLILTLGQWCDTPWGAGCWSRSGQPQLLADRVFEGDEMHALAAELGRELVTPLKSNRGEPWPLNRAAYRARNAIER